MKRWQLTVVLAVLAAAAEWLAGNARLDRPMLIGFVPTEADRQRAELNKKLQLTAIDEIIKGEPRIKACFADARDHVGYLPDVVVRMHLLPGGTVDDATVTDPATLADTGLAWCLTTTLESMGFPARENAQAVWLTYPFKF